mgnify:CR=1 FL=1
MSSKQEFNKSVEIIAEAIMQVISDYGLTSEMPDGVDTNLIPNIMMNVRKEWSWVLSKEKFTQLQDMLIDVYQLMFIERADKLLGAYIVKEKQTVKNAPSLVHFLKLPMVRAFQEVSKKYYNKAKYEQDITMFDDESSDQAFDRLMNAPKKNKIIRYDDDYIQELEEIKSIYEEMLTTVTDVNTLKSIQKKLDKVIEQINSAVNPKAFINDVDEYVNDSFSVEEDLAFDKIVDALKNDIKMSSSDFEAQIQLLEMLLTDFSPSEIARAMGVSPARISKRMKTLKDSIMEIAESFDRRGDDTLSELLKTYTGSVITVGNRIPVKNDTELQRQLNNCNIKITMKK